MSTPRIVTVFLIFWSTALATDAPRRIVSIAPSFTEILYSLGLDQEIVGTTNYCDYPPSALRTEKIGDALNPNVEKIISLHPDLVFCGAWKWKVPEQLRSVGISVVEIPDTQSIQDIYNRFLFIGEKAGRKQQAASIVAGLKSRIDVIRQRTAGLQTRQRAYVELDAGNWTTGGGSYMNEILDLAGLENVFRDRPEPYMTVTLESIASRDPDLIITLSRTKREFQDSQAWQALRAVRSGKILDKHSMNWDMITRQSTRLADGIETLERLAQQLK